MATETMEQIEAEWLSAQRTRRALLWKVPLVALALGIVSYSCVLARMLKQRQAAVESQWSAERDNLSISYANMQRAAAANDELAYELVWDSAQQDVLSIDRHIDGTEPREFVQRARRCLRVTAAAFNRQPTEERAACASLFRTSYAVH